VELKEETRVGYSFFIKPKNTKEKWNMMIIVSKNTFQVMEVSFNNENFVVDVKLSNYKLNNNFSKDMFKFVAPKNIEIINL
jgi:outer membrane lipoprotein-sorting protein